MNAEEFLAKKHSLSVETIKRTFPNTINHLKEFSLIKCKEMQADWKKQHIEDNASGIYVDNVRDDGKEITHYDVSLGYDFTTPIPQIPQDLLT